MNRFGIIMSSCLIMVAVILFLQPSADRENLLPAPITWVHQNDKSIDHELKEQDDLSKWFAEIHNASPDVNWRKEDESYRLGRLVRSRSASRSNIGIKNGQLQGKWFEKGSINQAGRVVFALYNQSSGEIYTASAGGIIWKSKLDSINWNPLNDQFRIDGINFLGEVSKRTQNRFVAVSQYGKAYYSDDTCRTWTKASGLDNVESWGEISKTVQCSDSAFYVLCKEWDQQAGAETYSVYSSIDAGETFARLSTYGFSNYWSIKNLDLHSISPLDSLAFLFYRDSIAAWNGLGQNFVLKEGVFPNNWGEAMLTGGRTKHGLNLHVYVEQDIYQSNGSASQWSKKGELKQRPFTKNSVSWSQKDTSALFFGAVELFKSYNNGTDWKKMNNWWAYYDHVEDSLHADIPFIGRFEKLDGVEFFLIGTDGGLYVSYDTMRSVKNLSLIGHNISQYYSTYTEPANYEYTYAGSQDQGLQRTDDSTANRVLAFEQTISGDYGHLSSSDSGNSLWAVYPGFVGYYQNAKADSNFTHTWNFSDSLVAAHWMPPLTSDPSDSKKAYLVGVYRKNDPDKKAQIFEMSINGSQIDWKSRSYNFNIAPTKDEYLSGLAISPLDNQVWYAVTNKGNFYYSFDGGFLWNRSVFFTGPGPHYFYGTDIYASSSNPNDVYVAGSGYSNASIYYSWNKGRDWRELVDSLPNTLVHAIVGNQNDSLLFAATEVGPFVYSKKEGHWFDLINGAAPDQNYWSVEFLVGKNTARFGTYGRGIWDFQIEEFKDSNISVKNIHKSSELYVYPNPASDHIKIGGNSHGAHYRVFDQSGREIIKQQPYTSPIDISTLTTGVYFLSVNQNGSTELLRFIKQ